MINETIEYKGYTINIENDDCAFNPFVEWDCLPNLIVNYDGCLTEYGSVDTDDILTLTREEVKNSFKAVQNVLCDYRPLLTILRTETYLDRFDNAVEPLNEYLKEFYEGLTNKDKLVMLSDFLTIKNTPHLLTESRGYSQGDYCELLLIADSEECTNKQLESARDLYSAWAWGDVYGFNVEDKKGDNIDSCWGFYGYNHEKSGLLEHAKNAIDCEIAHNRKQRLNKLKTLLKNKVAIDLREQLLIIA